IDELMTPRREALRRLGHQTDAAAIGHLLNISDSLEHDPVRTSLHIFAHLHPAARNAIRQQLGLQSQQPLNEAQLDEHIGQRQAQRDVARFEADENYVGIRDRQVKQLMSQILYHAHLQQAAGLAIARREVAQFEADPRYELFPVLRNEMQRLL